MTQYARDGLTFDLHRAGPSGGEPVVLLHGFPQDASCWDGVAARLHEHGYRTLAPDLRGYSPGARPRGRRAYRMGECVLDVVALLDDQRIERAHVVGHDWGSALAWAVAGLHPDRVRSLSAISVPHPSAFLAAMPRGQALRSWYMLAAQLPVLPELRLRSRLRADLIGSGLPAPYADRYADRMREPGAATAALNWYRALPWSAPVPPCPVPTTFLWGRRDRFIGRSAALATGRWVSGPYQFVELDGGHWLPETHAELVAEYVRERIGSTVG